MRQICGFPFGPPEGGLQTTMLFANWRIICAFWSCRFSVGTGTLSRPGMAQASRALLYPVF